MRIFPGVHYSMGRPLGSISNSGQTFLDYSRLASVIIPYMARIVWERTRLFRVSTVDSSRRPSAIDYATNVERGNTETDGIYDAELKRQQEINDSIVKNEGSENQYKLHEEMGRIMTDNVTVVRYNDRLKATDEKLLELQDRFKRISINDSNLWATQAVPHARQLWNMMQLARVITLGALNRNESRGAHYKPEFPERNDEDWLKTTVAEYSEEAPVLSYEPVDVSLVEPRKRDYSKGKAQNNVIT
jgi:succinate dehydrogenase / fumarate reductase flavoprotein subunit